MTDNHESGYRAGADARVVLHRHGARGTYAVAVVVDEGPYSAAEAHGVADALRETCGGWVTKTAAAHRLGLSESSVDLLRRAGRLLSETDDTGRVMIPLESLRQELERRKEMAGE
jgi:hypothetical protein